MMKRKNKDQAWVENYPPLRDWLKKHNARCMWQFKQGDPAEPHECVEGWMLKTALIVVQVYELGLGWNIYTSPKSLEIDKTLEEVERRLGLHSRDKDGGK